MDPNRRVGGPRPGTGRVDTGLHRDKHDTGTGHDIAGARGGPGPRPGTGRVDTGLHRTPPHSATDLHKGPAAKSKAAGVRPGTGPNLKSSTMTGLRGHAAAQAAVQRVERGEEDDEAKHAEPQRLVSGASRMSSGGYSTAGSTAEVLVTGSAGTASTSNFFSAGSPSTSSLEGIGAAPLLESTEHRSEVPKIDSEALYTPNPAQAKAKAKPRSSPREFNTHLSKFSTTIEQAAVESRSMDSVKKEADVLRDELQAAEIELNVLRGERDQLLAERMDGRKAVEDKTRDLQAVESKVQALDAERRDLIERGAALATDAERSYSDLKKLKIAQNSAQAQSEKLEKNLKKAQSSTVLAETKCNMLQGELRAAQNEVGELKADLSSRALKLKSVESTVADAASVALGMQMREGALQDRIRALEESSAEAMDQIMSFTEGAQDLQMLSDTYAGDLFPQVELLQKQLLDQEQKLQQSTMLLMERVKLQDNELAEAWKNYDRLQESGMASEQERQIMGDEQQRKIQELEQQLQQKENLSIELQAKCAQTQRDYEKESLRVKELEEKLSSTVDKAMETAALLSGIQGNMQDVLDQKEKMRMEVENKDQELTQKSEVIAEMETKLSEYARKLDEAEKQRELLRQELNDRELQLAQEASERYAELHGQLEQNMKDLQIAKDEACDLRQDLEARASKLIDLEGELAIAIKLASSMKQERDDCQQETNLVKQELSDLRTQMEQKDQELEAAQQDNLRLSGLRTQMEQDLNQKEEQLKAAQEDNIRLHQSLEQSQQECNHLQQELSDLRAQMDEQLSTVQLSLEKQVEELKQSLKDRDKRLSDAAQDRDHLQQEIQSMKSNAESLERQLEATTKSDRELHDEVERLHQELTEQKHECERLLQIRKEIDAQLSKVQQSLREKEEQVVAAAREHDELEQELQQASKQLAEAGEEKSMLKKQVRELEDKLASEEGALITNQAEAKSALKMLEEEKLKFDKVENELRGRVHELEAALSQSSSTAQEQLKLLEEQRLKIEQEYSQKLMALQRQLESKDEELQQKDKKLESVAKTSAISSQSLMDLAVERDNLEKRLSSMEEERRATNSQLADVMSKLSIAEAEATQKTVELAAAMQRLSVLETELNESARSVSNAEDKLDAETTRVQREKSALEARNAALTDELAHEVKVREELNETLRAERSEARETLELEREQGRQREAVLLERSAKEREMQATSIEKLRMELQAARNELAEASRKARAELEDVESRDAQVLNARDHELEQSKAQLEDLMAQLRAQESQFEQRCKLDDERLEEQKEARLAEKRALEQRAEDDRTRYEQQITELRATLQTQRAEVSNMLQRNQEELETQLAAAAQRSQRRLDDLNTSNEEALQRLRDERDGLVNELRQLKADAADRTFEEEKRQRSREVEVSRLQDSLTAKEKELEEAQNDFKQKLVRLEALENQLLEAQNEQKSKLTQTNADCERLQVENAELLRNAEKLRLEIKAQEAQLVLSQRSVEDLNRENEELKRHISFVTEQLKGEEEERARLTANHEESKGAQDIVVMELKKKFQLMETDFSMQISQRKLMQRTVQARANMNTCVALYFGAWTASVSAAVEQERLLSEAEGDAKTASDAAQEVLHNARLRQWYQARNAVNDKVVAWKRQALLLWATVSFSDRYHRSRQAEDAAVSKYDITVGKIRQLRLVAWSKTMDWIRSLVKNELLLAFMTWRCEGSLLVCQQTEEIATKNEADAQAREDALRDTVVQLRKETDAQKQLIKELSDSTTQEKSRFQKEAAANEASFSKTILEQKTQLTILRFKVKDKAIQSLGANDHTLLSFCVSSWRREAMAMNYEQHYREADARSCDEKEQLKSQIEELQKQVTQASDALQSELSEDQAKSKAARLALERKEAALEKRNELVKQLEQQLIDVQLALDRKKTQLSSLSDDMERVEKERNQLKAAAKKDLEATEATLRGQIQELNNEIARLKDESSVDRECLEARLRADIAAEAKRADAAEEARTALQLEKTESEEKLTVTFEEKKQQLMYEIQQLSSQLSDAKMDAALIAKELEVAKQNTGDAERIATAQVKELELKLSSEVKVAADRQEALEEAQEKERDLRIRFDELSMKFTSITSMNEAVNEKFEAAESLVKQRQNIIESDQREIQTLQEKIVTLEAALSEAKAEAHRLKDSLDQAEIVQAEREDASDKMQAELLALQAENSGLYSQVSNSSTAESSTNQKLKQAEMLLEELRKKEAEQAEAIQKMEDAHKAQLKEEQKRTEEALENAKVTDQRYRESVERLEALELSLAEAKKKLEDYAGLKQELTKVKASLEVAEMTAAKAEEIPALSEEKDRLNKRYHELLELHASEMAAADEQKDADLEALRNQLSSKIMELAQKNKELEGQIEMLRADIERHEATHQKNVKSHEDAIAAFRVANAKLEQALSSTEKDRAEKGEEVCKLQEKLSEAELRAEELKIQLANKSQQAHDTDQSLEASQQKIVDLQNEILNLSQEVAELKAKLEVAEAESSRLRESSTDDVVRLTSQLRTAEDELAAMKVALQTAEARGKEAVEVEHLHAKLRTVEHRAGGMKDQLEEAEKRLAEATQRMLDSDQQVVDSRQQVLNMESQMDDLKREMSKLKSEQASGEGWSDTSVLQTQLSKLELEVAELNSIVNEKDRQLANLRNGGSPEKDGSMCFGTPHRIKDGSSSLAGEDLRAELDQCHCDRDEANRQLEHLQKELARMVDAEAHKEEEIEEKWKLFYWRKLQELSGGTEAPTMKKAKLGACGTGLCASAARQEQANELEEQQRRIRALLEEKSQLTDRNHKLEDSLRGKGSNVIPQSANGQPPAWETWRQQLMRDRDELQQRLQEKEEALEVADKRTEALLRDLRHVQDSMKVLSSGANQDMSVRGILDEQYKLEYTAMKVEKEQRELELRQQIKILETQKSALDRELKEERSGKDLPEQLRQANEERTLLEERVNEYHLQLDARKEEAAKAQKVYFELRAENKLLEQMLVEKGVDPQLVTGREDNTIPHAFALDHQRQFPATSEVQTQESDPAPSHRSGRSQFDRGTSHGIAPHAPKSHTVRHGAEHPHKTSKGALKI